MVKEEVRTSQQHTHEQGMHKRHNDCSHALIDTGSVYTSASGLLLIGTRVFALRGMHRHTRGSGGPLTRTAHCWRPFALSFPIPIPRALWALVRYPASSRLPAASLALLPGASRPGSFAGASGAALLPAPQTVRFLVPLLVLRHARHCTHTAAFVLVSTPSRLHSFTAPVTHGDASAFARTLGQSPMEAHGEAGAAGARAVGQPRRSPVRSRGSAPDFGGTPRHSPTGRHALSEHAHVVLAASPAGRRACRRVASMAGGHRGGSEPVLASMALLQLRSRKLALARFVLCVPGQLGRTEDVVVQGLPSHASGDGALLPHLRPLGPR